jgi:hypothetical protein
MARHYCRHHHDLFRVRLRFYSLLPRGFFFLGAPPQCQCRGNQHGRASGRRARKQTVMPSDVLGILTSYPDLRLPNNDAPNGRSVSGSRRKKALCCAKIEPQIVSPRTADLPGNKMSRPACIAGRARQGADWPRRLRCLLGVPREVQRIFLLQQTRTTRGRMEAATTGKRRTDRRDLSAFSCGVQVLRLGSPSPIRGPVNDLQGRGQVA